jgi:hypothetical protein
MAPLDQRGADPLRGADPAQGRPAHDRHPDRPAVPARRRDHRRVERIIAEEAAEKRRSSLPLQDEPRKGNPWSHESQRFADELLHCELGRQAAREGWIGVLWDWIRNHGRMPRQNEVTVDWFRREAEAINAKYNECERGLGGIASKGLAKLGLQVLNRREEKAKLVLGEVEDA